LTLRAHWPAIWPGYITNFPAPPAKIMGSTQQPVLDRTQGSGGRIVNLPLAAGATTRVNNKGTKAYLVVATAGVQMRPIGGQVGVGDFNLYSQGTGFNAVDVFDTVEFFNSNAIAIVISVWIGFDNFIDNRLILANATLQNIAYPTQPTPTGSPIQIPDLSGGSFLDLNVVKWLPLFRQAIIINNLGTSAVLLQAYGAATSSGPAVLVAPPGLPIAHNAGGNYAVVGGSNTVIVSEIYQAILAT
jgi:hypothetical protein